MNELFIKAISETDLQKRADIVKDIKDFEHKNDQLTHRVFIELSRNFITPFDREDVHALVSTLDDVSDYLDVTAKKIVIYKMGKMDHDIFQIAEINREAINDMRNAIYGLRDLKQIQKINESIIKINGAENRADDVFDAALMDLIENEKDAATIIKKKDILQSIEFVSDKCEDVADVITSIIVKYA
jgi:predicted phosphate transport protein (TIGR00153 family)